MERIKVQYESVLTLKQLKKTTPPLLSSEESKSKFESVSMTTPTWPLEKRVSFQIEAVKDQETKLPKIPKELFSKGILKKTPSFRNTSIEYKEIMVPIKIFSKKPERYFSTY